MKSTGIKRPVDTLGRIVIPMEIRESFDIKAKDELDIYVEGDKIILKKPSEGCVFCGKSDELVKFEGKTVCRECVMKLASYN